MRLIDADALIEYCNNQKVKTVSANDIARFPSVDAAPVVHGVWKDDRTDIMCTACNERFSDEIVFVSLRHLDCEMWMKYCPYCGAKMDGGAA